MKKILCGLLFAVSMFSLMTYVYIFRFSIKEIPFVVKFESNFEIFQNGEIVGPYDAFRGQAIIRLDNSRMQLTTSEIYDTQSDGMESNSSRVSGSYTEISVDLPPGTRRIGLSKTDHKRKIKIVLYSFRHGMLRRHAEMARLRKCTYFSNCELVTVDRVTRKPIEADAIVFQGNNVPAGRPARQSSDQVFVYLNIEAPQYLYKTDLRNKHFDDFYNWTMTYRRDSDIPYWYGSVIPRYLSDKKDVKNEIELGKVIDFKNFSAGVNNSKSNIGQSTKRNHTEIFRQKTKSAVWFVSHCGAASMRDQFVEQMKPHIDIDIFGSCSNQTNECPKSKNGCHNDIESTYKFFFAFENSLCEDYITEKVFNWFMRDIVLVVRGARFYRKYLPAGTFIDTDDFESPVHLANYLAELATDEQRYAAHLARKDQFQIISGNEHVLLAYCALCYRLNNLNDFRSEAKPLHDWWVTGRCTVPDDINK